MIIKTVLNINEQINTMELSREQQLAYDKYIKGYNIFITGPGGAGKSALIKMIHQHAYKQFKEIQVTALTGCAAVLLNCKAKTLHSWAGIGLGNGTTEQLITKIKKSNFAKALWKTTDILVVDEISMLSLKLFNTLNAIGKAVRGNSKPFGGIQIIFSGDFFQLPPVGDKDEPDSQRFCFESEDWNDVFRRDNQIQLIKIYRQTDEVYSNILNQIREGKIKRKSNDLLLQYVGRPFDSNLVAEPTKLYPTRNKVDNINNTKMSALHGEEITYSIKYLDDLEMTKTDRMRRLNFTEKDIQFEHAFLAGNLICEKEMMLKIGSQVMCIINFQSDAGLEICNGSQGIITKFCEVTRCPVVKYNNGVVKTMAGHVWASEKIPGIGVSQIPLILAWALTIHKSQGATMDAAEIDVGSGIFECGQTYVALSRVKSLNGLYLTSFDANRIRINKKVKEFYESLTLYSETNRRDDKETYIPLVIAEPITIAQPIGLQFAEYEYVEARVEQQTNSNPDIKVIKISY
jgi:ATP-dependent DNA helicase PIF1